MTIQLPTRPAPSATAPDPLAPVREFLLAAAHEDAATARATAEADADTMVEHARARAREILADAERQGVADGTALAATERMRARRQAREILLRAQRDAYEDLRARARLAVRALRDHASYPVLRYRLGQLAKSHAGANANLAEHPQGGVVAAAPDRRVDCSLDMLADRALDALGAEVEGLWAP